VALQMGSNTCVVHVIHPLVYKWLQAICMKWWLSLSVEGWKTHLVWLLNKKC
jgi:hypothetical protein